MLYEAEISQFAEDIKKWKDRYVVIKNDFSVESYDSKEVRCILVIIGSCGILIKLTWLIGMSFPWPLTASVSPHSLQ